MFQPPLARPIRVETDADLVTWDLSAGYKASERVNLYGRIGTGFRAPSIQGRIMFCVDFEGGTNPETNCVSVADEEKITSVELGVKSELLDRKLRLNFAVYDFTVDGQQLVAVGGQSNTARLLNADKTNGYGFEADINVAPNPRWLLTFGTSYNKTEIDDPNLLVAYCGGGCTVTDPTIGPNARVDGNPLPHAPEWIFDGIIDYRTRPAPALVVREPRLGLPQREELLPLRVEGVQGRLARDRPARRLHLRRRQVRAGAVRAQPARRGDRPGRHRLQQPDRHDQRPADDRPRVLDPVLAPALAASRAGGALGPAGASFSARFRAPALDLR